MDTTADLTPQESLALADSYFVDEDYELAVDAYAAALALLASDKHDAALQIRALSHRSAAFYKLGRYQEARDDAYAAIASPLREGLRAGEMELCHKRLGLACLALKQYPECKTAMEQAMQLASLNKRPTTPYREYIRQCNDRLNVKETAAGSPKPAVDTAPTPRPVAADALSATSSVNQLPTMPKYQYYQNDKFMTIAILESGVQQDDLQVTFRPKTLSVVLRKRGVDFTIIHGTLCERVDVEHCKVKFMHEKVLIKLRKVEPHEWHDLLGKGGDDEEEETKVEINEKDVPIVDSSKTRPYASHRDWDAIERNLKLQEEREIPEGEEAVNKLFRDIYSKADDDTKRAMIKSYQTSGGTVLSTNWSEVANTDYEAKRTAPKGMEWKNWEGDKLKQKEDNDD